MSDLSDDAAAVKAALDAKIADANAFADKQTSWVSAHAKQLFYGAVGLSVLAATFVSIKVL